MGDGEIRASQHGCPTVCTVIDEISRDELNRTFIHENQRLIQTMNLNCCAEVQCAARVFSNKLCGLHACTCLACGTLAGLLVSVAGFLWPAWG